MSATDDEEMNLITDGQVLTTYSPTFLPYYVSIVAQIKICLN